ncbi:MAG: peptidylprolyl isomerase [Acidiferrobacterales bacterium]
MQVNKDKVVTIDYTLEDNNGTVIDSSEGGDPFSYIHGIGAAIPGLEAALEGKSIGEELAVSLTPGQAYGERDESLVQVIAKDRFEAEGELEVGMQFRASTNAGETRVVTITKIDDDDVTVDGNHPLAGVTLNFAVAVRGVRDATEEELAHGHVHGPEGPQH